MSKHEERMEDFESMLEASLKQPPKGATVKGEVVEINGEQVIVNMGMKTEGAIDRNELPEVKVGDKVELFVVGQNIGDYMRLSKKTGDDQGYMKESIGKNVKVKIESHVEKGYRGKVGDIDAFIPENHIDLKSRMKDPTEYIGKTMDAKVLKSSGGKFRSLLVSPKDFIMDGINNERKTFLSQIKVDSVTQGTVKTVKEYGAFISLGALDGFLHKSNIAWGRPRNPAKYVKEGDVLDVKILEINEETCKIEVGLKQLTIDPWDSVHEKFPVNSTLSASIIGRRRNGYISEVEPGIDAFIPMEELSWLKNIHKGINPKDQVEGRVLDYDNDHKRVIISVKMMTENPWKTMKEDVPEGSIVEGTIKNITEFGIFVDFGQVVDGLVRKGDISWTDEAEEIKAFKAGDKIKAKILRIDEERERVSLGIKQLGQNPWKDMGKNTTGKPQSVKILTVQKTGLEVELANGIKGEISIQDLDPASPSLDNYKPGDEIIATIVKTDSKDKKVVLSVKKLIADSERKEAKEYMKKLEKSDEGQGFGAVFKDILK